MIQEPRKIAHRRPNLSFTYGTSGRAQSAPRLYAEEMIPRSTPRGSLKSRSLARAGP
ncbi:hypothetical protein IG631_08576 [Alternaria alternata]|nr:hypothetical protein IG631_08576 [Alternaria alternata]